MRKLLIGVEVSGYAEKQLKALEELAEKFASSLPHQISIGSAHLEIFKEAGGEVSKSKPRQAKGGESPSRESRSKAG